MTRKNAAIDLAKALGRRGPGLKVAVREAPTDARPTSGQGRAPSRAGQTNVSGWFDMAVKLKLDELRIARQSALGRRVTQQELLSEAFNDLFMKYGLPEMAPSRPDR